MINTSNQGAQAMKFEQFQAICDASLDYLVTDYGYEIQSVTTAETLWRVTYRNRTTEINVAYDRRDECIDVRISPATGDKQANFWQNSFYLQNLLVLRAPDIQLGLPIDATERRFTLAEATEILTRSASALRLYATDFLRGDFSFLPVINAMIRQQS